MDQVRWKQRFENFSNGFMRFQSIRSAHLQDPTSELAKLALIQSFEFTFELAWKTLKDFLVYQGVEVALPREVIKQAFKFNVLREGQTWIDMLSDRNRLSHEYSEARTMVIVEKIATIYYDAMKVLIDDMAERAK